MIFGGGDSEPRPQEAIWMRESTHFAEQFLQSRMPRPADRQLRPIVQHCDPAVFCIRLNARDTLQVYDVRAMYAHEFFGIELRFHTRNGLLLQVIELFERNYVDLRAVFHDNALELLLRSPRRRR